MEDGLLTTTETLEYLEITRGALDKRLRNGSIKPAKRIRNERGTLVNLYSVEDVKNLKGQIKYNKSHRAESAPPPEGVMTTAEVAKYLLVSQNTVRDYAKRRLFRSTGRLERVQGRPELFNREEIEQFKASSLFVSARGKARTGGLVFPLRLERQTTDEYHPTGCIIHWEEFYRDSSSIAWVPITCAACRRKYNRRESGLRQSIKHGEFTGCCRDCSSANRRIPEIKNGRIRTGEGYIFRHIKTFTEEEWAILEPMSPRNGIYIPEHRAVMALHLGRPLTSSEVVHHIDGQKDHNQITNLEIFDYSEHTLMHKDHLRRELKLKKQIKELKSEIARLKRSLAENGIKTGEEV